MTVAAPTATTRLLTGAGAVVEAMRQIRPDVVPVYPITPQTPMIQGFAKLVADGAAGGEIVNVESEHSAMSAAVGSALAGARTMTATSSQGLALMAEVVYLAAAERAPIVMAVGNRALSGPINIHCDHSDSMLVRDSGAIQLFAESVQEVYDLMLLAPRLAEHPDVLLPVMICQDGFTLTHSAESLETIDDVSARGFVGDYSVPFPLLDLSRVTSQGALAMPDYYFELKHQLELAHGSAAVVFDDLATELETITGRPLVAVEPYALDGAERVIVMLGSTAGTVKDAVDELRGEGEPVGLLRVCSFRPFPEQRIRAALEGVGDVVVLDRSIAPGARSALAAEVAFALRDAPACVHASVYGLGGRDLLPDQVRAALLDPQPASYIGLRR